MSNLNEVDAMLGAAARQARQQSQVEQQMRDALKLALENPHTVKTYRLHMAAIQRNEGSVTLAFGLVTGERLEFEMPRKTAEGIATELLVRDDAAEAA